MLLKPYSINSGTGYTDFLRSNYICRIKDHGLKKINAKGLNKIGKANDPAFKELTEENIQKRKLEELELNPILISEEEKKDAIQILKTRFDERSDSEINFSEAGSSFTIEIADIISVDEMRYGDLAKGIEIIKDSMIFADKGDAFESFCDYLQKYTSYLENPSEFQLIEESRIGFENCIKAYPENPYAHFLNGLVYHRPTKFHNPDTALACFRNAKKYSQEIEDHYMKALSGFMISWLCYVKKDLDVAISELLEVSDEEFMRIPEVYYNLSKFYAYNNDAENSIKYLDEAVTRFDYFYSLKADIDDDFIPIKKELIKYFKKIIADEKDKISENLKQYGITLKNDASV